MSNYKRRMCVLLLTVVCMQAVCYAETARRFSICLTADSGAVLTAYLPAACDGRAVVVCPGGGYRTLSMRNEGADWAPFFNDQGIACFVLKYRMPNGNHTLPVSDAEQAIRMVRDSASLWQIHPHKVGIMGFSAGGHLASTIATHATTDCRPDFQILFYPVITMDEHRTHKGSVQRFLGTDRNKPEVIREYSNEQQVKQDITPPAIILLGEDDATVPATHNGIAYYQALKNQGVRATLVTWEHARHGFGFKRDFAHHEEMKAKLSAFLHSIK